MFRFIDFISNDYVINWRVCPMLLYIDCYLYLSMPISCLKIIQNELSSYKNQLNIGTPFYMNMTLTIQVFLMYEFIIAYIQAIHYIYLLYQIV